MQSEVIFCTIFAQIPDGTEQVTLLLGTKHFKGGDYKEFFIFVPPSSLTAGFSLTEVKEQEKSSAIISHVQSWRISLSIIWGTATFLISP